MKININLISIFVFTLVCQYSYSQIAINTDLRNLAQNTEFVLNKPFTIPANSKSVLLDEGTGKICSCQFFTTKSDKERIYKKNKLLYLNNITIKGLFDGSQMHIARIYFIGTDDYFKFKCYTRDILVNHLSEFFSIGNINVASED